MKKTTISLTSLLSAILLFSSTVSAQTTTNYNLSAYKLPDYRYRQLETEFELSGNNNSTKQDDLKILDRSFKGNVVANYYSYMNSRKTQRSQYLYATFNGQSAHSESPINIAGVSSIYSSLSYQIYNKRYFANKIFVATGVYTSYHYGHINDTYEFQDTTSLIGDATTNEHDIRVNIPLEFGIGRIEQVQDYQEAIYIYEDLLKSGRAVAGKSEQEVMELATLISRLKNQRYFDSRIKNIQDIETLDSFLIANNFKIQSDARYFATLVDNWNFVNHFIRESGTSIALAVTPNYNYYQNYKMHNLVDVRHKYMRGSYGIEGGIVFKHHKPLNLYWQTNTTVRAMAGYTERFFEDSDTIVYSEYTSSSPALNMSLYQTVEYFPNTRTRMTASFHAGYNGYFEEKDVDTDNIMNPTRQYINTNLSLMVDYYISQRLRLNATSSVTYNHTNIDSIADIPAEKRNGFYSGFRVKLAYSIF